MSQGWSPRISASTRSDRALSGLGFPAAFVRLVLGAIQLALDLFPQRSGSGSELVFQQRKKVTQSFRDDPPRRVSLRILCMHFSPTQKHFGRSKAAWHGMVAKRAGLPAAVAF